MSKPRSMRRRAVRHAPEQERRDQRRRAACSRGSKIDRTARHRLRRCGSRESALRHARALAVVAARSPAVARRSLSPESTSRSTRAAAARRGRVIISPPTTTEIARGLLRDHDHDRVRLLGDPDRRAVARADALRQILRSVSGRMQPACAMRPCWIITAPSCSGEYGRNSDTSSSFETAASSARAGLDLIVELRLALEHDQRADPLLRERLRRAHDLLERSAISCAPQTDGNTPRPTRASARRMSCWKSTMMISTADDRKLSRIQVDGGAAAKICDDERWRRSAAAGRPGSAPRACPGSAAAASRRRARRARCRACRAPDRSSRRVAQSSSSRLQQASRSQSRSPRSPRRAQRERRPRRATRAPATSWTRTASAPAKTATAQAACVAASRSPHRDRP